MEKVLFCILVFTQILHYWNTKDALQRIEDLEHEIAVLKGEMPF